MSRHGGGGGAGAGAGGGAGADAGVGARVPWAAILEQVFQAKMEAMGFDHGKDGLDGLGSTDGSTDESTRLLYRLETSETLRDAERRRLAAAPMAPLLEARQAPMLTAEAEAEGEAADDDPSLSARPLLSSSPFMAMSLDLDFTPVRSSRPYQPSADEDEAEAFTSKRPRLTPGPGPGRIPSFNPTAAGVSPAMGGGGLTPRTPGSTPYGRPTPMPNTSTSTPAAAMTPAAATAVMAAVRTSAEAEAEVEEERAREVKRARHDGGGGGAAQPAPHVAAALTRERREASAYERMLASWASGSGEVPVTHTPAVKMEEYEQEEEDDGVHDVDSFLDAVHDEAAAFEAKLKAMM